MASNNDLLNSGELAGSFKTLKSALKEYEDELRKATRERKGLQNREHQEEERHFREVKEANKRAEAEEKKRLSQQEVDLRKSEKHQKAMADLDEKAEATRRKANATAERAAAADEQYRRAAEKLNKKLEALREAEGKGLKEEIDARKRDVQSQKESNKLLQRALQDAKQHNSAMEKVYADEEKAHADNVDALHKSRSALEKGVAAFNAKIGPAMALGKGVLADKVRSLTGYGLPAKIGEMSPEGFGPLGSSILGITRGGLAGLGAKFIGEAGSQFMEKSKRGFDFMRERTFSFGTTSGGTDLGAVADDVNRANGAIGNIRKMAAYYGQDTERAYALMGDIAKRTGASLSDLSENAESISRYAFLGYGSMDDYATLVTQRMRETGNNFVSVRREVEDSLDEARAAMAKAGVKIGNEDFARAIQEVRSKVGGLDVDMRSLTRTFVLANAVTAQLGYSMERAQKGAAITTAATTNINQGFRTLLVPDMLKAIAGSPELLTGEGAKGKKSDLDYIRAGVANGTIDVGHAAQMIQTSGLGATQGAQETALRLFSRYLGTRGESRYEEAIFGEEAATNVQSNRMIKELAGLVGRGRTLDQAFSELKVSSETQKEFAEQLEKSMATASGANNLQTLATVSVGEFFNQMAGQEVFLKLGRAADKFIGNAKADHTVFGGSLDEALGGTKSTREALQEKGQFHALTGTDLRQLQAYRTLGGVWDTASDKDKSQLDASIGRLRANMIQKMPELPNSKDMDFLEVAMEFQKTHNLTDLTTRAGGADRAALAAVYGTDEANRIYAEDRASEKAKKGDAKAAADAQALRDRKLDAIISPTGDITVDFTQAVQETIKRYLDPGTGQ